MIITRILTGPFGPLRDYSHSSCELLPALSYPFRANGNQSHRGLSWFHHLYLLPSSSVLVQNWNETSLVKISGNKYFGAITHSGSIINYLDIPYADPPIRFHTAKPYTSTPYSMIPRVGSTSWPSGCISQTGGTENCLVINVVRTTRLAQEEGGKGRAVLVWIYGGGYILGSGSDVAPYDILLLGEKRNKNLIFVSFK